MNKPKYEIHDDECVVCGALIDMNCGLCSSCTFYLENDENLEDEDEDDLDEWFDDDE